MRLSNAVGGNDCIIYFTRKSQNERFYKEFEQSGCVIKDISKYTDNKFIYFMNLIYRGIISTYINSQNNKPVVFNGQCNFGYKISPWIRKEIPQLEFIHTFCSFSYIRVPFIQYYKHTISSSKKTIDDHKAQYNKFGIAQAYADRFKFILYGIELPAKEFRQFDKKDITVLFVGRGSAEKRVYLIAAIAKEMSNINPAIKFEFMGDVKGAISQDLQQYCYFWNNQTDQQKIHFIYKSADILILTSIFEGFPLVVMEAMARGLAIISTAVGDVPVHVKDEENGFVIQDIGNEKEIIQKGIICINRLSEDRELLKKISDNNIEYAFKNFGLKTFTENYKTLFETLNLVKN